MSTAPSFRVLVTELTAELPGKPSRKLSYVVGPFSNDDERVRWGHNMRDRLLDIFPPDLMEDVITRDISRSHGDRKIVIASLYFDHFPITVIKRLYWKNKSQDPKQ